MCPQTQESISSVGRSPTVLGRAPTTVTASSRDEQTEHHISHDTDEFVGRVSCRDLSALPGVAAKQAQDHDRGGGAQDEHEDESEGAGCCPWEDKAVDEPVLMHRITQSCTTPNTVEVS